MHAIVIGAGVVGATSADYLSRAGHDVTVVDQSDHVAAGASFANGGQLSYSFTDAMASPAFLKKIPRFVLGMDPAVRLSSLSDLDLYKWSALFLRECTSLRHHQNSVASLKLALRSSELFKKLLEEVTFDIAYRKAGKLVLIKDKPSLELARKSSRTKRELGCDAEVVSLEQACEIEPALAHMPGPYVGAVYSQNDEVADARSFSEQLLQWLADHRNVTLECGQEVHSINYQNNKVTGIRCADREIASDAVVVCAGAWTQSLIKPFGLTAQIYPVKGYSITLPVSPDANQVSLTDQERKVVFSRLGSQIRIAGFADFAGFSARLDKKRINRLLNIAEKIAPLAANYKADQIQGWAGFRPMTPDGQPRVGPTSIQNLFLNTGHGMFGWTLACATGYDLASRFGEYYARHSNRK